MSTEHEGLSMEDQIAARLGGIEAKLEKVEKVLVALARVEEQREHDKERIVRLEQRQDHEAEKVEKATDKLEERMQKVEAASSKMAPIAGFMERAIDRTIMIIVGGVLAYLFFADSGILPTLSSVGGAK